MTAPVRTRLRHEVLWGLGALVWMTAVTVVGFVLVAARLRDL